MFGPKPLFGPILINWALRNKLQWYLNQNKNNIRSSTWIWKCRLHNGGHFVSASIYQLHWWINYLFQICVIGENETAALLGVENRTITSYTPGLHYFVSHANSMFVNYTSPLKDREQGFSLSYQAVNIGKCGRCGSTVFIGCPIKQAWHFVATCLVVIQVRTSSEIDGLVQDCSISIANTLEIMQYCTEPPWSCYDKFTHFLYGCLTIAGNPAKMVKSSRTRPQQTW